MDDSELLKQLRGAGVKAASFGCDDSGAKTIVSVEFFPRGHEPEGVSRDTELPSPASHPVRATIPPVLSAWATPKADNPERPEAPAFQPAPSHEVGIGYLKGVTYQYAYPRGARPEDACRWSHIDETEVREELWDIQPGDIVYDLGSAFGSYALSALALGAAHVVCVNPNPDEQALLLASARLNGWADKITQIQAGLWSEVGYLNDEEQIFLSKAKGEFMVTKTLDGRHTQLFPVQTLDSLQLPVREGRVVLKADLEGAERKMLEGARIFFAQHQPAFATVEVHVFKDASLEQQTDAIMDELGYVAVKKRPYHSVMHALYRMKGWDD